MSAINEISYLSDFPDFEPVEATNLVVHLQKLSILLFEVFLSHRNRKQTFLGKDILFLTKNQQFD